jgi:hypothetical protein
VSEEWKDRISSLLPELWVSKTWILPDVFVLLDCLFPYQSTWYLRQTKGLQVSFFFRYVQLPKRLVDSSFAHARTYLLCFARLMPEKISRLFRSWLFVIKQDAHESLHCSSIPINSLLKSSQSGHCFSLASTMLEIHLAIPLHSTFASKS